MTSDRRDFHVKAAKLSGASLLAGALPKLGLTTEAHGETVQRFAAAPAPDVLPDAIARPTRLGMDPRLWKWHSSPTANDAVPANYYEAFLAPLAEFRTSAKR